MSLFNARNSRIPFCFHFGFVLRLYWRPCWKKTLCPRKMMFLAFRYTYSGDHAEIWQSVHCRLLLLALRCAHNGGAYTECVPMRRKLLLLDFSAGIVQRMLTVA